MNSELRRELASRNFDEIVGKARNPMMQEVAMRTRKKTKIFGIQVVDVRIKRADLPKQVEASVFQRMRAERERAAKPEAMVELPKGGICRAWRKVGT